MGLSDLEYAIIFWVLVSFPVAGIVLMIFSKDSKRTEDGLIMFIISLTVLVLFFKLVS